MLVMEKGDYNRRHLCLRYEEGTIRFVTRIRNIGFCALAVAVSLLLAFSTLVYGPAAYASTDDGMLVIGIDPGHDSSAGGANYGGVYEYDVNWDIACALRDELNSYQGVKAVLSRDKDAIIPSLAQRVVNVRNQGADLVVSVHCNYATGNPYSRADIIIPNDSSYLYELHTQADAIANLIGRNLVGVGFENYKVYERDSTDGERYPDGSGGDYYTIINASRRVGLCGMIVEHGFMNNARDFAILRNPAKRVECGKADARAIAEYYGLQKPQAIPMPTESTTCSGTEITLDMSGIDTATVSQVFVDGVGYDATVEDGKITVGVGHLNAKTATVYTTNPAITAYDQTYPTAMYVWLLDGTSGVYKVTRATAFDNSLQYAGSSIKIAGKNGIRMITGVPTDLRKNLIYANVYGYTLEEYGTVCAWESSVDGSLLLSSEGAASNYAYKRNKADPVYSAGNITKYTNVLVGFPLEKTGNNFVMRAYMKLSDAKGNIITLYGGQVYRSIGYIAKQNANAFPADSAAYAFVHNIINYVYGS